MQQRPAMAPEGQITNWAEFAQYAQQHRSANDLLALSNIQLAGQRPSRVQIIALDRFTNADIDTLRAHAGLANWAALTDLAALTRSGADLVALSALQVGGQEPTVAQLQRLAPATTLKITTLQQANLQKVVDWDALVQLSLANQSAETIIGRASIQIAGAVPTLQELLDVDTYSNDELNSVHGLGQTNSWGELGTAVRSIQSVMLTVADSMMPALQTDLLEVGNALGEAPTIEQYMALLVDIDSTMNDDLTRDEHRTIMADYIQSTSYNACFDGAARLVDLLGTEHHHVQFSSVGARTAEYAQAAQHTRAQLLGNDLQQAAATGVPTLFRVHLGGHGFTLTVEHNRVHQLETLAGAGVAGRLLQGMRNGYIHDLAQTRQDLLRMTSDNVITRIAGAQNFYWNAGPIAILQKSAPNAGYDQVKDPMAIYWTASPMCDRTQVVQRFAAKIQANRNAIVQKIGANL